MTASCPLVRVFTHRTPAWVTIRSREARSRLFEVLPFARSFLNSLVVAGSVTLLGVATSALAAYAFARLRFGGRKVLFLGYLGTLMMPLKGITLTGIGGR